MYEHIIVPFDGSEPAQHSVMVGADLSTMLHSALVIATANAVEGDDAVQGLKAHAMAMSDERATVWVEPHATEAGAIANVAAWRPNSLLCMSTHARTGVLRAVYASLAERLVHDLDSPVLLLGPEFRGDPVTELGHLIVCFDGSPVAEAAIPLAGQWAQALPLNITLLHVKEHADDPDVDLARFAQPLLPLCDVVDLVEIADRRVVPGILDVVQHSINPFVVMATHSRTGLARLLAGSLTADVLRRCPVPVLVQRGPLPSIVPRPAAR